MDRVKAGGSSHLSSFGSGQVRFCVAPLGCTDDLMRKSARVHPKYAYLEMSFCFYA